MNYSRRQLEAMGEPLGDSVTREEAGRRIYGGGGSSSSSSSNSTTTTNIDKRQVNDNGAVGVTSDSSTVNVSVLDNGAIDKAIDLAKSGTTGAYQGISELLGFAKDVIKLQDESAKLISKSAENVGDAYQTANEMSSGQKQLATVGLVVAGVVGFVALKGKH
jgi:hypothetical protein